MTNTPTPESKSAVERAIETLMNIEPQSFAAKNDWQPISTAPKDGTQIRLYIPAFVEGDKSLGYAAPGQREGFWAGSLKHGRWVTPGTMSTEGIHPSHWMPLPSPPESEE